jgi:hypothetical protein
MTLLQNSTYIFRLRTVLTRRFPSRSQSGRHGAPAAHAPDPARLSDNHWIVALANRAEKKSRA